MIDPNVVRSLLDYDADTGMFRWRENRGGLRAGAVAGSYDRHGYMQICIHKRLYLSHRLAWLYVYGVWPSKQIDHINCARADNSIANLREATRAQNSANAQKRAPATSAKKGVTVRPDGRYMAQIQVRKKKRYLGLFATEQEAHDAYCEAAKQAFGAYHRPE